MAILDIVRRQSIYGNGGTGTTFGCDTTSVNSQDNPYCGTSSSWNDWIRWVALACIVAVILLLFFTWSCVNARRRRRAGQQPLYGTAWTARYHHDPYAQNQYGYPQNNGGFYAPPEFQPAPPYTAKGQEPPKYDGPALGAGQGDIELQRPGASYVGSSRFEGEEAMHGARK